LVGITCSFSDIIIKADSYNHVKHDTGYLVIRFNSGTKHNYTSTFINFYFCLFMVKLPAIYYH